MLLHVLTIDRGMIREAIPVDGNIHYFLYGFSMEGIMKSIKSFKETKPIELEGMSEEVFKAYYLK